jgi:hypothetical protein
LELAHFDGVSDFTVNNFLNAQQVLPVIPV